MRVLPSPVPVRDSLILDSELYTLRLQKEIWGEARQGFQGQVDLLKEIVSKQEEKYTLLNDRFLEKSKLLDKTIEEKNRYKYRRSFALFGGRATFMSGLVLLGLGAIALK
jgi:hypothetical protein